MTPAPPDPARPSGSSAGCSAPSGDPGLTERDRRWLAEAVRLSAQCVPSATAFSVGAVLVGADGVEIARGFSRQEGAADHAEEVALRRAAAAGAIPVGATIYSSLEPCGYRLSRPAGCAQLIIDHGIRRVVFALAEPDLFVPARGARWLRDAGVTVLDDPGLAGAVRDVNAHLLSGVSGQAPTVGRGTADVHRDR